ncbi:hypothetical protein ABVF61_03315 [Roseibium sp. HPY-6]|uniref:peptidoglycan-binding domain-containing protein n=1 Tax=Roseibium sp. HPY-6 TaxID=3229852 RepID=UPI00338F0CF1
MLEKIQIERSVGHMARNNMADVRKVQERLNELLDPSQSQLVPDGINGPRTKDLIGDFQTKVVGFKVPDKRVDPVGKTISALNDIASKAIWKGQPLGPRPVDPKKLDPDPPVLFDKMPKIGVIGPVDQNGGFDTYPPPAQVLGPSQVNTIVDRDGAWIMVPVGGEREISLDLDPDKPVEFHTLGMDEDGVVNSIMRDRLLRATVNGRNLKIKGLTPCKDCRLDIVQDGRHLRLYVSVKPLRILPLYAFRVDHGRRMKTRVSSSELRSIVQMANSDILRHQCNIEFDLKDDRELSTEEIGRRIGHSLTVSSFSRDELQYLTPFAVNRTLPQPHGAEEVKTVNLFFVREIRDLAQKGADIRGFMKDRGLPSGICVIDDHSTRHSTDVKALARILAHEVGHMLIGEIYTHGSAINQAEVHNPYRDALMFSYTNGGYRLYRVEIETMNPTKRQQPMMLL